MSTASTLRLELSPSAVFAGLLLVAHAAAAVSALLAVPGAAGAALAALLMGLGAASAWTRALLRGASAPRAIEIGPSGEAVLVRGDGKRLPVAAVRGAGVTRGWVALRCGRDGFLVCAGMLGDEPLRRLRLWALWQKPPGAVARGQLQARG
ncbi:MAG TPA: hypothetical protein VHN19_14955 [Burkholderiales bacterium]|nr:hypothetical protein [Burkholderiales bacterium]HEX2651226.1 hypothetical protein [Burkholderiales bacterium]